jgi:hypothetical protein
MPETKSKEAAARVDAGRLPVTGLVSAVSALVVEAATRDTPREGDQNLESSEL